MKIKITKDWKEKKENNFFKNGLKLEYLNWLKANVFFAFACLIWFFSVLMMPVNYQLNGSLTPIYNGYGSSFSLTALGIITIILFIFFVLHTIGTIVVFVKNKHDFFEKENANKKARIAIGFGWGFLIILLLSFFILMYIYPNTNLLLKQENLQIFLFNLEKYVKSNTAISNKSMIDYFNNVLVNDFPNELKTIANYTSFGSNIEVNAAVLTKLSDVSLSIYQANNFYFTPLATATFNTASFANSAGWYLTIIFFSLCLFYYLFLFIVLYFVKLAQKNKNLFDFKQKKEFIKMLFEEAKKSKQTRKENKKKNKELIEQKEELLNNLNEVQLPPENELGEIATPIELSEVEDYTLDPVMTQEQLLEKIEENNRIKAKIKEIDDQRQKIKKEQGLFFRKKNKDKNNPEKINKRSIRVKKQEIAIPDKELEDIFKNLEIE